MKGSVLTNLESGLGAVLRLIPIICLVGLGTLLTANVAGRFSGAFSMPWFDEAVSALFAWMVFIGAAALWREREHFAIDLVPDLVRQTWAATPLKLLLGALGLAFAGALTWYGSLLVLRTTATTPILALPQAWIYACIPLGGAVMTAYACRDLIGATRKPAPPGQLSEASPDASAGDPRNPLTWEMDRHAL